MLTKKDLFAIEELLDRKLDERFKNELTPIRRDLRKIKKDLNLIITIFDRNHLDNRKRIERIENQLNLPPVTS